MTRALLIAVGVIWGLIFLGCGGMMVVGIASGPRPSSTTVQDVDPAAKEKERERRELERAAKKRVDELRKRSRELQRQYVELQEDAEHTKRRVELGEISAEYGITELQAIAKQAKRVDDEHKRLESELYEIKRGTWKPKPSP